MSPEALSIAGLSGSLVGVGLYWLYTLAGVDSLRPLLGGPRRALLAAGVLAPLLALFLAAAGADPFPRLGSVLCGLGSWGLAVYAWKRQWLFRRAAVTPLVIEPAELSGDTPVVLLSNGSALTLTSLGRHRLVQMGRSVLVRCRLADSIACFEAPAPPLTLGLPLRTGFSIVSEGRSWDGIDGRGLDHDARLTLLPVTLLPLSKWRVLCPDGALHGDEADRASYGAASGSEPCPTPLLPEARGLAEPMTRGVVRSGRWTPLDSEGTHEPAEYYLARWAALARGLAPGASSS